MKQKVIESQVKNYEKLDEIWDSISEDVTSAFRMDKEEKNQFKAKKIAKLIGCLPFLAECEDAKRTAIVHLGTYILSCRETKPYFHPTKGDNENIFERLRLINCFKGGNKNIIRKGMSLIALTMLNDYKRDINIDETLGKYNPLGDKVFNYENAEKELRDNIDKVECEKMDTIFNSDVGTYEFWSWG